MAKAKKKVRPETPPLYATIENGAIKPAFAFDAERLASYRNHAKVLVWIDYEGSRPGQRKWYAVIQTALKGGNLPWADLSSADISLRLALDMYEPRKTNDGNWHRVPSSLNDYDDKELDEKVELLQALIYRITGINPKDFERERAGAGDEEFRTDRPAADNDQGQATNSSGDSSPPPDDLPADPTPVGEDSIGASNDPVPQAAGADATNSADDSTSQSRDASGDSGGAEPDLSTAAPDQSHAKATEDNASTTALEGSAGPGVASRLDAGRTASGAGVMKSDASASESSGEEEKVAGASDGAVLAPAAELSEEDRKWLQDGARMMLAAQPEPSAEAKDVLFRQVKSIIMLMPKAASADARTRMEQVKQHCMGVCRGEADLDVQLVARTALATVAEITPAPVTMGRKAQ